MQLLSAIAFKHAFSNTALCSWLPYHYCESLATHTSTKWTDPTGNMELLEGFSGGGVFLEHLASLWQVSILTIDCSLTSDRHSILVIFKALI